MNGLMLHCGAGLVDLERVEAVNTPEATDSHFPIPHIELINLVREGLGTAGYDIVQEAHGLGDGVIYTTDAKGRRIADKDQPIPGGRYFGLLEIAPKNFGGLDSPDVKPDYGLVAGLRNSHDKTFRSAFALGGRVFVCDNMSFSGEVVIGRKHTLNILRDLPNLITGAIQQLGVEQLRQAARFDAYKAFGINDAQAHDLAICAMREGVFAPNRIKKVVEEWHEPSHDDFAREKNVWRLFNGVTEAVKPRGQEGIARLNTNLNGLQKLHTLLDNAIGFEFVPPEADTRLEIANNN